MTNINLSKSIQMNIEVKTYDIDVAGHVNNLVYVRWLEDLRNKLFSNIHPLENLIALGYYPVVISNDMKYKSSLKLFDNPYGKIFIESYLHGIITLNAEIINNNKTIFQAKQKCVLMNLKTQKMFMGTLEKLLNENERINSDQHPKS